MRLIARILSVSIVASLLVGAPVAAANAASVGRIESSGPLTEIATSPDLSCQVKDSLGAGGSSGLFAACGFVVVVDGALYRPATVPGHALGGSPFLGPNPLLAPQYGGTGTNHPWELSTYASVAPEVYLNLFETYVEGSNTYYTNLSIQNDSDSDVTVAVYRIVDCRIQGSTSGTLAALTEAPDFASARCISSSGDYSVAMTSPKNVDGPAPVARAGNAADLWAAAAAGQAFSGAPTVGTSSSMGMAMNWNWTVPAGDVDGFHTGITLVQDLNHDGVADNGEPPSNDTDGDGLPNAWEERGVTIEGEFLDLPGWGASPERADIFLQVNWMSTHFSACNWIEFLAGCSEKRQDFGPSFTALNKLVTAFAAAPVVNPDGSTGITLHVDAGDRYPTSTGGSWDWPNGGMTIQYRKYFSATEDGRVAALTSAIDLHMRPARQQVFHLLVLGDAQAPGDSARSTGVALMPGDSLFVAAPLHKSEGQLAATIMHELGHNLGLAHGGPMWFSGAAFNCKPAYRSVMNYMYQLTEQFLDYARVDTVGNPAPTSSERKGCDKDYPTSTYDTKADWPSLQYSPGQIGGANNGEGSEIEVELPEFASTINDEPTMDELEDAGLVGSDGDGGVTLASPLVLFAGKSGQSVPVTVFNLGSVETSYSATIAVGSVTDTVTVTVPAGSQVTVPIELPAPALVAGEIAAFAQLTAAGGGPILSEYTIDYTVLESDPDAAQQVLNEISATDPETLSAEQRELIELTADTLEVVASGPVVDRLAGPDRYATAVEVSKEFDPGVPIVYIATGLNYPDALSAGAAAAAQGGPVLLTTPDSLPAVVKTELARLDPEQIVVVGSTASVSATVATQLAAYGPVRRDGGTDRYQTSRILIERAFESADTVYVATGANFPDALSASPAAATDAAPVLLVPGASSDLPSPAGDLIEALGTTSVVIAGGTGTVSAGIQSDIDALPGVSVTRKAGSDRFGTSLLLNQHAFTGTETVFLATGLSFPDALAGGALAGGLPAPLFAVLPTCIPPAIADEIERLGPARIVLLGGTPTLAPSVEALTRC